ncbi:MAG: hypothetical protein ABEJ65_09345, partial [bacterium]
IYRQILSSSVEALLLSLTISLGMPFLTAANQIFPDLVSGILVFIIIERVLNAIRSPATPGYTEMIAYGFLLALLPWLHLKQVAVMIVLGVGVFYFLNSEVSRYKLCIPLIISGISLIGVALWNQYAFGTPLGPHHTEALSNTPRRILQLFFGLHLDQAQGMFLQQPLFLLGLLGLPFMYQRHPRFSLFLVAVYGSLILPNTMHPNFYGGRSFHGRFAWSSVLLWNLPLAFSFKYVIRRFRWIISFISAGVLYQIYLSRNWIVDRRLLMVDSLFYENGPGLLLPDFHPTTHSLYHLPNYVALFIVFGIFAWGVWLYKRSQSI